MRRNDEPSKKNNPNHLRTAYLINIMVLCTVILLLLGGVLFLMNSLRNSEKELALIQEDMTATSEHTKSLYTSEEVDEKVNAASEIAASEARRALEQEIQTSLESGESVETMLRDMFPDNYVVASGDKFYFYPILKNVKTNLYSADDFVKGENGRITYQGTDQDVCCDFGIDVSSANGEIDWEKAALDGVKFVMVRAAYCDSDGNLEKDECFEENVTGARENGITVGVYFRMQAITDEEASDNAQFIVDTIAELTDEETGTAVDGPIALVLAQPAAGSRAFGQSRNSWTSHVANFIAVLNANGYNGMIYGNGAGFAMMLDLSGFEENEKWISDKSGVLYFPYRFSYWQYGEGEVDGIDGNVNFDLHIYGK